MTLRKSNPDAVLFTRKGLAAHDAKVLEELAASLEKEIIERDGWNDTSAAKFYVSTTRIRTRAAERVAEHGWPEMEQPSVSSPAHNANALEETKALRDAPAEKYPVPVVCAVIIYAGQVLLERRATTGVEGLDRMWDVPGGKMEREESPQEAVIREIQEEQGIAVAVGRMLPVRTSTWVYEGRRRYWLLVPFVCSLDGGLPTTHDDLKWWPIDALPNDMLEADRKMVNDATAELRKQAGGQ